jgi:hypothetical protein
MIPHLGYLSLETPELLKQFLLNIVINLLAGVVILFYARHRALRAIERNLPSWHMLYEHDAQGKPIRGTLEKLEEAVKKAYDIKVEFKTEQFPPMMRAEWVFRDPALRIVHALNTSQISVIQDKDASGNLIFPDNPYHYFVVVNTNGVFQEHRVHIGGAPAWKTPAKNLPMVWFGLIPPTPPA